MTLDRDERLAALRTSDFGRCVYRCDNDVVDHQVVAMEMRSGTTVAFTMHGHSHEEGRTMRYDGTRATLRATFTDEPEITVIDHGSREVERIDIGEFELLGHGGPHRCAATPERSRRMRAPHSAATRWRGRRNGRG